MDPELTSPLNSKSQEEKVANRRALIQFITAAGLSIRATNVLLQNCSSLEELHLLSKKTLLTFPNCGRKTVREILSSLDTIRGKVSAETPPSVKEQLAEPPEESSIYLLPLFSSKEIEDVAVEDLHSGFRALTKLADLDLSARTANVLHGLGIETIGEVILTPRSELLGQQNFGRKSLSELKELVRSLCLTENDAPGSLANESVSIDYTGYDAMVSSFVQQCEKNKRNQKLLMKRLCFQEGKLPTLEEIGQYFEITRERTRQILKKATAKLQIKANLDKVAHFWERLDCILAQGGGIIHLGSLPTALKNEFNWSTPPYYRALGQLLLLRQPDATYKEEDDLFMVESECLTCDQPLQRLLALDFEAAESFHVQVIAAKLCDHCQNRCPWKRPVTTFHRAFIERLVEQSEGRLVLHGNVVLTHDKWVGKYCENLEGVACHVLESHGKPMHFSEIASAIRRKNAKYSQISDRNVHAAIIRYDKIEIINRGNYGLKSWGLGGYRSVSTAIEEFIDEKGLPQRRQDIIQYLNGEYTEGNITSALATETRFTSIGDGFYDRPQNWEQRSCQNLIEPFPVSVAEFVRYLVGRNNTSCKLVMAFIFIRSMNKNGAIYLSKLKEMFYNFYLSRHKQGLIVETDTAVVSRIGELPVSEIKNKACSEPLKSFLNSSFFIQFSQNGGKLRLTDILTAELGKDSVRDIVLITILKAIDDYFQKIAPSVVSYVQEPEKHHKVAEPSSLAIKKSEEPGIDSSNTTPTISIKKKKRGKIRL